MKVILQKDVKGQGKKGQMVEVSDGYARNFLFPKKLAVEANTDNINVMKQKQAAEEARLAREKAAALELAEKLKSCKVVVSAKAGNGGRLFGSVTTSDVADALKAQFGIEIDRHKIVISENIKAFGTYELKAKLYNDVAGKFSVIVKEAKDKMDELLSRQLPHSIEAEQSVLGSMLIDPGCIAKVVEILRPEDFFMTQNRHIYETIFSMFTLNETIDAVAVLNQLEVRGHTDASGGKRYLLELMDVTPTAANVDIYIKIVKDKALMRSLGEASNEISDLVVRGEGEAEELVEIAEQKIYSIRSSKEHKGLAKISNVLMDVYDHLGELAKNEGKVPGVPSGFKSIDNFLSGFNDSDLVLLAARPGMGKTSAALNFATNAAKLSGKAVVIFSLEMSNEQLALRLISSESLVDSKKLRTGVLNDDEWVAIAHASAELSKLKLYLDDTSGITVPEMKAKCRRISDELGMIVIDYLQLMSTGKRSDNRVQEVSEISRSLKIMAKELGVPVLCLSQLSRGPEQRKDNERRPRLADLRESGAIEQDADVVLFIYRDDYYTKDESEKPGIAEILVEKNRHGEVGTIELHWDGAHTRFSELDRAHQ